MPKLSGLGLGKRSMRTKSALQKEAQEDYISLLNELKIKIKSSQQKAALKLTSSPP